LHNFEVLNSFTKNVLYPAFLNILQRYKNYLRWNKQKYLWIPVISHNICNVKPIINILLGFNNKNNNTNTIPSNIDSKINKLQG